MQIMRTLQNPRDIEEAEILIDSLSNALLKRRKEQVSTYYQIAAQDFIYIFKENYFGESFIYIDDEKQCIIRAVRCFLFSKNETTIQSLVYIFKKYLRLNDTQKATTESKYIFNKLITARSDFWKK